MQYRAEIDGLRALAVMPVILFHAGLTGFEGGFVGVDVFFVISGYLITRLIVEEMAEGRFSLWRFYERRARRILPALAVVVLATLPFAWTWMLPVAFKDYAQSLVAVAFFASNVLFWREADYFGPDALEKPMLHTWSLSVEEQFYVLFPLFLLLMWRFGRRPIFWMIMAGCVASLAAAQIGARYNAQANFYLPVGRAWELGLGALCAMAHVARGRVSNDVLAWTGLAMIVGAIALFDSSTPTPSLWTLVPVGGAALIVLFAGPDTQVGRLLSLKPLVAIGLVSYSAYLWHYPIFAFAHIKGVPLDAANGLIITAASLVLAGLTWRFVEQPFRGRAPWLPTRLQVFGASAATLGAFVAVGVIGAKSDLRYTRYAPELAEVLRDADDYRRTFGQYGLGTCFIDYSQGADALFANGCLDDAPALVLFGDSHAAHLSHGLREAAGDIAQYTGAECAPYMHDNASPRCRDAYIQFMRWADGAAPRTVVLSADWLTLYDRVGPAEFTAAVTRTVTRLKSAGHQIALVRQTPSYRTYDWRHQLVAEGRVPERLESRSDRFTDVNRALARLERREGALGFDPAPLLCRGTSPYACDTVRNGRLLYTDRTHVTPHVSVAIGEALLEAMRASQALTLLDGAEIGGVETPRG